MTLVAYVSDYLSKLTPFLVDGLPVDWLFMFKPQIVTYSGNGPLKLSFRIVYVIQYLHDILHYIHVQIYGTNL